MSRNAYDSKLHRSFYEPERTEIAEWFAAAFSVLWGAWLLAPWAAMSNPAYAAFRFASEGAWGLIVAAVGAWCLYTLAVVPARRWLAFSCAFSVWALIVVLFAATNWRITAVPTYSIYALYLLATAWRA